MTHAHVCVARVHARHVYMQSIHTNTYPTSHIPQKAPDSRKYGYMRMHTLIYTDPTSHKTALVRAKRHVYAQKLMDANLIPRETV